MTEETNPLKEGKFKNIGIDADFVQEKADEHNNQINKYYHGGQKSEPTATSEEVPAEAVTSEKPQADLSALKKEIEELIEAKVNSLAAKMQQYANQTDGRLDKLESSANVPPATESPTQAETKPQTSASEETQQEDVAIDKIFDFSGNPSGKIKK